MYAAKCGAAALGLLAMRGLPIDKDHAIYHERVASLPTALFSGSDIGKRTKAPEKPRGPRGARKTGALFRMGSHDRH